MWFKVAIYHIQNAYYRIKEYFGGNVVLLTDPRWKDDLHIELEDFDF
jgi:hypothetical protein